RNRALLRAAVRDRHGRRSGCRSHAPRRDAGRVPTASQPAAEPAPGADRVVMGAAVLVTGLLLIVAGLVSARIPGGASFARPGISASPGGSAATDGGDAAAGVFAFARRGSNPIRAFILSPIHPATWYANGAIAVGFFIGLIGAATVIS